MQLKKGPANCITDIKGVKVGHVTLYEKLSDKETICTGVTAILPHGGNLFEEKVRAASYVINGFGKTVGLIQVDELGLIESPIMLTNTFSVGAVLQGTLTYMLGESKEIGDSTSSLNIVVGECNDSYLNSMRLQAVKPEHAIEAINKATTAPVIEGAVGAGKGMVCYDHKGGVGTASRLVTVNNQDYTVGALVLSNFGSYEDALFADLKSSGKLDTPDGSIMIIVATDAPLYDRQLRRIAKRAGAGLARTGSQYDNGSGDIVIAFSTANKYNHQQEAEETLTYIRDDHASMNQFFKAVTESAEEAILNSLKQAETTTGRMGRVVKKAEF